MSHNRLNWIAFAMVANLVWPALALAWDPLDPSAATFGELGVGLQNRPATWVDVHGDFRMRSEGLYNFDLDRGPTPSGALLFAVPLSDPKGQWLYRTDFRGRSDVAVHAPGGQVAFRMRLDVLNNAPAGTAGTGEATTVVLRRAWGEVLLPFGVLAAGRMGSHWGMGLLSHGGDCADCNTGDAADRIALVSPLFGHLLAVAYDFSGVSVQSQAQATGRFLDLDPQSDVRSATVALLQWRGKDAILRRLSAGQSTLDYGLSGSYQWQDVAFPTSVVQPTAAQAIPRHLRAAASDLWLRYVQENWRIELEGAYLWSQVDQPSLMPGVLYRTSVQAQQWGAALQQEWGNLQQGLGIGVDAGVASGDPAPGFSPPGNGLLSYGKPGDFLAGQVNVPHDNRADDFHFHPDFHVDEILFRNLIGTVTDAAYLRPHARWRWADFGAGRLDLRVAAVASTALYASSTPGGARPLGVEIDPSVDYWSRDGFGIALHSGILFPLSGLDNRQMALAAHWAGMVSARIHYRF